MSNISVKHTFQIEMSKNNLLVGIVRSKVICFCLFLLFCMFLCLLCFYRFYVFSQNQCFWVSFSTALYGQTEMVESTPAFSQRPRYLFLLCFFLFVLVVSSREKAREMTWPFFLFVVSYLFVFLCFLFLFVFICVSLFPFVCLCFPLFLMFVNWLH